MDHEDLAACGEVVLQLLKGDSLALDTCIRLANDHINSIDFHDVDKRWLRLYTDASLLRSELDVGTERALEGIRRVDMAIIVAGALGREEWAQDLIQRLQSGVPRHPCKTRQTRQLKLVEPVRPVYPPIREIVAPTFDAYVLSEHKTPFIVKGFADWPAMHRWRSADYLLDITGEGRVVPVETGRSYVDEDWGQDIISWRTFLEDGGVYLAQHTLFKQFPQLERDIVMPDYVWAEIGANPVQPIVNVWIGGDTLSPAHTDPYNNCYVQVLGTKRVWVAPPDVAPLFETYDEEDGFNSYMSNTAKVNVFEYDERLEKTGGTEAVLSPGDLLVIPAGWWHAMQGLGDGWSVSVWY